MPLYDLLNVPKNQSDWEQWSFANRNQIDLIRSAILKQKNINLTPYQLYPIDFSSNTGVQDFLQNNSQEHDDFNAVLGFQSSDIESVDINDQKQLEAWINLVYQELLTASSALGI